MNDSTNMKALKLTDIVYREDLYPRTEHNPALVQTYAASLEHLPPIEVNQHNILIDGWHRWTAHQQVNDDLTRQGKPGIETIDVTVTETPSEAELKMLAAERNSTHGWQMTQKDKQRFAVNVYLGAIVEDRAAVKDRLRQVLAVSSKTLQRWFTDIDKATRKQQQEDAYKLWLACYTQEEIAERVGVSRVTITDWTKDFVENGQLSDSDKINFTDPDYQLPLTNVWTASAKSNEVSHFGNTEARWLENLLWLYTEPFDIVVDPFAGGGSTIDVCRKRSRRYYVSDRLPITARKDEIRQHDLTRGLPAIPRWKDVMLVYLDPPYWKQAENQYSSDPEDLANMDLATFNASLANIINGFADKLSGYETARYIALIIQPTFWRAPNREYTDHVIDMCLAIDRPIHKRYQVPYSSQQLNAQMMTWAKENRESLVISREIVVWRIQ